MTYNNIYILLIDIYPICNPHGDVFDKNTENNHLKSSRGWFVDNSMLLKILRLFSSPIDVLNVFICIVSKKFFFI